MIKSRKFFESDTLVTERFQDIEPILERNKRLRGENTYTPSRDMRLEAEIPLVVVEKWMKEGINIFDKNDWPKIERMLNSDHKYLKTITGRL